MKSDQGLFWKSTSRSIIPTPPSFSARAYFWCFNLQEHSFNLKQLVLKICSNYFKFAANLFNLKKLYFICSNFILFAATFFNLQQLYFICSNFLICNISLVGYRTYKPPYVWDCTFWKNKSKFFIAEIKNLQASTFRGSKALSFNQLGASMSSEHNSQS